MSIASVAAARAQSLSCWQGRDVTITHVNDVQADIGLGEGRTNQNFIATDAATGERFFVRIGSDLPAYGVTRAKEQAAARAVGESGLGARVIHAELPDALVCAFVDGRSLTEAEVKAACDGDDPALLAALTAAMRRLHAMPMPAEVASLAPATPQWAPPDVVRWLAYARERGFSRLPLLDGADALLARVEAAAGPLAAGSACFCHFDLLPDNFVCARPADGPPSIAIVDFEYCNAGQPLMDVAVLCMGCALSPAQERALLCSYLEVGELSAQLVLTASAVKVLATLRETLWGVVAEVSGSSALSADDAAAYTDDNFGKFEEARRRFEELSALPVAP